MEIAVIHDSNKKVTVTIMLDTMKYNDLMVNQRWSNSRVIVLFPGKSEVTRLRKRLKECVVYTHKSAGSYHVLKGDSVDHVLVLREAQ